MSAPAVPSISVSIELDRQQISYLLCVLLTAPDEFADHLIALLAAAYHESRCNAIEAALEASEFAVTSATSNSRTDCPQRHLTALIGS